ncbi:unnamed protein product, partial [Brassica rapa subsp. trilocularis]
VRWVPAGCFERGKRWEAPTRVLGVIVVSTRSRIVESCFRLGLNGPLFGPLFVLNLGLYVSAWMP